MVLNQVSPESPERRDPQHADVEEHFFVVSTEGEWWYVSTAMARFVEACLDQSDAAVWVKFVDVNGSRIRVRAQEILSVVESSAEQRAASREFSRRMNRERKADRDYENDD